jgi:hypothetical protein
MRNTTNQTSLRHAAIIAGTGLLVMVIAAPFSELFAYPKIVVPGNAQQTVSNIAAKKTLFISCIFGYLITFILDIVVAWALLILLKPVNKNLSLLAAWLRLAYSIIAMVALLDLVSVLRLVTHPGYRNIFDSTQLASEVMLLLGVFRDQWHFALILFGIHLCLLGYLVARSVYIPWFIGVLIIVSGIGYLLTAIRPYLLPGVNLDFAKYTFYGELVFMLWLLIKGWRIKEPLSN